MQFLKTLLIVLTVGLAVAFAINNWNTVPVLLWGGLIADVNLPLLMVVCFLAGLLPMWLTWITSRWRLRNRLATTERAIADLRSVVSPPAPPPPPPPPPPADPIAPATGNDPS
jgi:hypothetical protein